MTDLLDNSTRSRGWLTPEDCRLAGLRAVVEQTTDLAGYPHADSAPQNVLLYGPRLREVTATDKGRREVQAELARALIDGPGIVMFKGAFSDTSIVDRATDAFKT